MVISYIYIYGITNDELDEEKWSQEKGTFSVVFVN